MSYFSLFQSPHPARGATRGEEAAADITDNFNPRTPRGVRRITGLQSLVTQVQFQSTHPARGATPHRPGDAAQPLISIHAPREGCDEPQEDDYCSHGISIHAPREGCDEGQAGPVHHDLYFNPRTPRGVRLLEMRCKERLKNFNPRTPRGVRHSLVWPFMRYRAFQSTHPARGATQTGLRHTLCQLFQSTHPARGATISAINSGCSKSFQSTHPARGATSQRLPYPYRRSISIHAPREGCDGSGHKRARWVSYFNPRTPRGVRLSVPHALECRLRFQSTHPARGATRKVVEPYSPQAFQSTHPARGATSCQSRFFWASSISIHAPREGCDLVSDGAEVLRAIFQSTHPARGATSLKH